MMPRRMKEQKMGGGSGGSVENACTVQGWVQKYLRWMRE